MPGAKRLRHQRAARRDLSEVWKYTARVWRPEQADAYLVEMDHSLQQIATGKALGSRYNARFFKYRFKAHVIFYHETAREIIIVRVLHGHMDFERHLPT